MTSVILDYKDMFDKKKSKANQHKFIQSDVKGCHCMRESFSGGIVLAQS
jgi:hypothetical protein